MYGVSFLVKDITKMNMFGALSDFSLHYELFMIQA